MNRRGVIYDVGTPYGGMVNTRPVFHPTSIRFFHDAVMGERR